MLNPFYSEKGSYVDCFRPISSLGGRTSRLIALVAATALFGGQGAPPPESSLTKQVPTLDSLQRQLDALQEGQRQLSDALREIQESLRQRREDDEVRAMPERPSAITMNLREEPFRGEASARFAMVEYSDFNCGFCTRYATNILPQIEKRYLGTGKLRYYFRDLPDRLDPDSLFKAQVARCAGEQGKFWEMHDRLFTHSLPLLDNPGGVHEHSLALGLNAGNLMACLQSARYAIPIQRLASEAQRQGLQGTPSFLIGRLSDNGEVLWATKTVLGADSFDELRTNIDEVIQTRMAVRP